MDNNKNRIKRRVKSKPELGRIRPKENLDARIINGKKFGAHNSRHEKN